jgi:hypothetical protein
MRKIAWERWLDFDPEVNEHSAEEEDDESQNFEILPLMVRTPLGAFCPYEQMSPTKMFDCWIGHTNFDITEVEKNALDQVEGIEVLKIMSRYRFFIGIGKLFNLTEVRPVVEEALFINKDSIISQIINEISGKKKWAICLYEDGSHISIHTDYDKDEAYTLRLAELKKSGGINMITSDEF